MYTYTCGNTINNNDDQTHFFRKIYLSHCILERVVKGLCVWELSWRRNRLQNIDPKFLWLQQYLFLILLGSSTRGHWGLQALCLELVLTALDCNSNSNCNWLQLTETVCGTGSYNCLMPTCFLWASHLHRIQSVHRSRWYIRLGSPVSWLTARLKVNMLHWR